MTARWALDHLVVGARTLAEGVAWCEAVLGVVPAQGGSHPLMGTHNRLLAIGSADFPQAYLEILAVDPQATAPAHPRWFGLDDPVLQQHLAERGPALVHWVARCENLAGALQEARAAGVDAGVAVAAQRPTPQGLLRWQIALRADGRRPAGGALPTLIEWGAVHPAASLPPSAVRLRSVDVRGWPPALDALRPPAVRAVQAGPVLTVVLETPRGPLPLASPG